MAADVMLVVLLLGSLAAATLVSPISAVDESTYLGHVASIAGVKSTSAQLVPGSENAVMGTPVVESAPSVEAYDPLDESMYVASQGGTGGIDAISGVTGAASAFEATTVGHSAAGIVFLSTYDSLYVSDSGTNAVYVFNVATGALTTTIPVGESSAEDMIYVSPDLYVACSGGYLVEIDPATNSVAGTITFSGAPQLEGLIDDPNNGLIYLTAHSQDEIYSFNPTGSIVAGPYADGVTGLYLAYDSVSGDLYVPGDTDKDLAIFSTASDSTISTISLPLTGPGDQQAVDDPADGEVYVTCRCTSLYVVNDRTNALAPTISLGSYFSTFDAYDFANGDVFVSYVGGDVVSIVDGVVPPAPPSGSISLPGGGELASACASGPGCLTGDSQEWINITYSGQVGPQTIVVGLIIASSTQTWESESVSLSDPGGSSGLTYVCVVYDFGVAAPPTVSSVEVSVNA